MGSRGVGMRRRGGWCAGVGVALATAGCALYVASEPPAGDVVDAGVATCDPARYQACAETCIYGCDARLMCADGRTPRYDVTPTPCWAWTGECPPIGYTTCALGCDVEGAVWPTGVESIDHARLCAEYPTARVGDACEGGEYECRPTRLEVLASGELRQTYLECANRVCIEDPAPAVGNFLAPCDDLDGAELDALVGTGRAGAVMHQSQPCLVTDVAGCLYTGHTRACVGDWDCPQGASCDDAIAFLDGASGEPGGLCRPGLRGTSLAAEALTRWACAEAAAAPR